MPDEEILALASTRIGRVLRGKYRLDRVLGFGGMAVVYAATHRNKKRFAIKVLHPQLSMIESVRTRFLREGYVANTVDHSGAVTVLDDDVAEDGSAFIVMDLLDGLPLDAFSRKHGGAVSVATVVAIGDALLDVLAAAHAKGVVHRDIKPANLFLTNDGRLQVLDFGIAQLRDETSATATRSGATMGTPAYMAPEQALGESRNVDAQTDLWAAGATLFTLLTGQLVHADESPLRVLVSAATKPARSLGGVAPEVPEKIAGVIDKALSFEKTGRWPSANAMRQALRQAWLETSQGTVPPLPKLEKVTGLEETMEADWSGESSAPGKRVFAPETPGSVAASGAKASAGVTAKSHGARTRFALVGAVVMVGVLGVLASRGTFRAATPAVARQVTAAPRPGRPAATPAAAAAFEAALQAERDGNDAEVGRSLDAAIASDPGLGAAYLRRAIERTSGDEEAEGHADYQKALEHRASLGEVDAALLDAWEPRFRDPPDRVERTRRVTEVAKKYPNDVSLRTQLANCLIASNRNEEGEAVADRAMALDPHYIPAILAKMAALREKGDVSALAHLAHLADACIETSPTATTCFWERMKAEYREARCSDLKVDVRHVIAIDPDLPEAYANLAEAMTALGEPMDSVKEALQRGDALVKDPVERHLAELQSAASLEVFSGDLGAAEKTCAERVAYAARRPNIDVKVSALMEASLALEEGEPNRAHRLLKATRARIDANGMGERDFSFDAMLAAFDTRAGGMTREELRRERARLLAVAKEDSVRRGGTMEPFQDWLAIYAAYHVESAEEAAEALTALREIGGVSETFSQGYDLAMPLGNLYAFGGRGADAVPLLERATQACAQLGAAFVVTHALYALGIAREQTGDVAGARAAYEKVLYRWGNAKPRSVTADKARARLAALAGK